MGFDSAGAVGSGHQRRRSCNAAADGADAVGAVMRRPPDLRCSGRRCCRSCNATTDKADAVGAAMRRLPELRCNGHRRRRSCNAAATTPPELRCSGCRLLELSTTPELRCSGRRRRRSCDAAGIDTAGVAMQDRRCWFCGSLIPHARRYLGAVGTWNTRASVVVVVGPMEQLVRASSRRATA